MQEVSKQRFYEAISDFEWIPFTQNDAYCRSQVPADSLRYYLDNSDLPRIGCVGFHRRHLGLKLLRVVGECRKNRVLPKEVVSEFYEQITHTDYSIVQLNLDTPYSPENEIAMRLAGYLRPIGLYSTTLSKIILTDPEKHHFNKHWRNNLNKSQRNNLLLRVIDRPQENDIRDFADKYAEMLDRKHFSDSLSYEQLSILMCNEHYKMLVVETETGERIAGRIMYIHGQTAYGMYSYTNLKGRNLSTSYFLYEQQCKYLYDNGIEQFDVGRISPGQSAKNGIFHFKDGVSGEYVKYLGEWEFVKNRFLSLLLFIVKVLKNKQLRI
mgnify:CR=1 FL=1